VILRLKNKYKYVKKILLSKSKTSIQIKGEKCVETGSVSVRVLVIRDRKITIYFWIMQAFRELFLKIILNR
jgi:hypothetical protein